MLAALAVLATPVQCSMAMGAHSLFVDPRDMLAMAADHAGHDGHMGHAAQAEHTHAATESLSHHEPEPESASLPASIVPQTFAMSDTATEAAAVQVTNLSSQVDVPTLRQFSGFVDAASPVAIGGPPFTLSRRWSSAQAHSLTERVFQPVDSWAESPPP